jgi:hypothetical protein
MERRNVESGGSSQVNSPTITPLTSQPDSRILDEASPEEIEQQTPQRICLLDRIEPSVPPYLGMVFQVMLDVEYSKPTPRLPRDGWPRSFRLVV